ncbi:class I SAM-dependent methyltransferase [Pseudonocardia xishanensis]|uniref:Methyltransferase domain-containing protein n=1 Tax=Pseudonocardia xishanensis TaxID=630995 RepID=A0ABP8S0C2_9PSEU
MNVGRALLIPHVVRLSLRAPRDVTVRWDRYWASTTATGDTGDVLWDASSTDEPQRYVELLAAHADPTLPVVDAGCGNGRYTRALAGRFDRVVGVDIAAAAIARARRESAGVANAEFRVADLTDADAGRALHDELGDCTVFVRGVLHVLGPEAARRTAATVAALAGRRGTVLLAETDYRGPLLGYLESLGGGPRGLPAPLARALSAGLPRPHRFGDAERDAAFPPDRWERVLVDHTAVIRTVPLRTPDVPDTVPGHVAVLRPR